MAKIVTIEDLQDKLDYESSWRKKELDTIHKRVVIAEKIQIKTELRIGIVMLYAHWEGFVKSSIQYYFSFVFMKDIKFKDLEKNFKTMQLEKMLNDNGSTIQKCNKIVHFFENETNTIAHISKKVDAKSNLNFKRFSEVLDRAGLNFSKHDLKEKLIDEKLLKNRNSIAHGSYSEINKEEFIIIFDTIFEIITELKEDIIHSASKRKFLKNT